MREIVCDYFSHYYDKNPINILGVGESFWDGNRKIERKVSDLSAVELVLEGEGFLENNGKIYELHAGDIFLLRKGTHHIYYNKDSMELHKLYITLSGDLTEILMDYYLPERNYVYHNCNAENIFRKAYDTAIAFGDDYNGFLDECSPDLIRLLNLIAKCRADEKQELADKFCEYLNSHINKDFSLDMMSDEFGYSKNHIINVFKEKYKITPYRYYTNGKLEAVKFYLLNTDFSLTEISEKMSFSNQQYFSAWFKSLCGISLSDFRQKAITGFEMRKIK